MRKFRSNIAGIFALLAVLSVASVPASANSFWYSDYDDGWSPWSGSDGIVGGTARLTFDPVCNAGPDAPEVTGKDEFSFSFLVGASCYAAGQFDGGALIAFFTWEYLNDLGNPVNFSCLNVRGTASTDDGPDGAIEFGAVSFGATSATNRTSDQLTDVDRVGFALILPGVTIDSAIDPEIDELGAQGDGYVYVYEVSISIRRCSSGWDGPDIEHYRRMAELAEALPNTR